MKTDHRHRSIIDYGHDWFTIRGPQLHSSEPVVMQCQYRGDRGPTRFIFREQSLDAIVSNVVDEEERGLTTLGNGMIRIRQVEHVMSALAAMNCPDTDVKLCYEADTCAALTIAPPIAHLETTDLVLAIRRSFPYHLSVQAIDIPSAFVIQENGSNIDGSFACVAPYDGLHVTVHINFATFLGKQMCGMLITPESYERDICWARSFFSTPYPHKDEWKILSKRFPGLLQNRMKHSRSVMIDYNESKWITPVKVRDEPARHKLLDLIGDLALIGTRLNAAVYVYKPHHMFNRLVARELHRAINNE